MLEQCHLAPVCECVDDSSGKLTPITVLQPHADIDRLYRDCSVLNFFFQDWVRSWFPSYKIDNFECCNPKAAYKDAFRIRVPDCIPDIVRGPIKSPNRVISKVACTLSGCVQTCDCMHQVYRAYRGQMERVTDLIRCAIVFSNMDEIIRFIEVVRYFIASCARWPVAACSLLIVRQFNTLVTWSRAGNQQALQPAPEHETL